MNQTCTRCYGYGDVNCSYRLLVCEVCDGQGTVPLPDHDPDHDHDLSRPANDDRPNVTD